MIDLHVHTSRSDVLFSTIDTFKKAEEKHLLMSGGSDFHDDRYEIGKTGIGAIDYRYCLQYP